jgi:hypothetical protein
MTAVAASLAAKEPMESYPRVVLAVALLCAGCSSPFMKQAANTPNPRPSKVLVAGFALVLNIEPDENKLIAYAQNSRLGEVGMKATELVTQLLVEQGYTPVYDPECATKLAMMPTTGVISPLSGQWHHPATSALDPAAVDSLFVKPRQILRKLRVPNEKGYFAFVGIDIQDTGFIVREPTVVTRVTIWDQDSHKVLDVQGIGSGRSMPFASDRTVGNLTRAVTASVASVQGQAPEPL